MVYLKDDWMVEKMVERMDEKLVVERALMLVVMKVDEMVYLSVE